MTSLSFSGANLWVPQAFRGFGAVRYEATEKEEGWLTAVCTPHLPTSVHLETLTLTNGGMVLISEHWSKMIYFLMCVVDLLQVSYHRSWNPAGL